MGYLNKYFFHFTELPLNIYYCAQYSFGLTIACLLVLMPDSNQFPILIPSQFKYFEFIKHQGVQEYRDTGIQGYRDTGIQGYRDTGIQGYRDTGIQRYKDTGIEGYIDSGIHRFRNTGIQAFTDTEIQEKCDIGV